MIETLPSVQLVMHAIVELGSESRYEYDLDHRSSLRSRLYNSPSAGL